MAAIRAEDLVKALERQGRPIPRDLALAVHPDAPAPQVASPAPEAGYWTARYDASWFSRAWRATRRSRICARST